jgi:hypothetical protein
VLWKTTKNQKFLFDIFFFTFSVAPDVARLGTQRLSQPDNGYDDYKIDKLVTPKEYTFSTRYNDILLLHLDRDIG